MTTVIYNYTGIMFHTLLLMAVCYYLGRYIKKNNPYLMNRLREIKGYWLKKFQ